jgi:hypothetical protein
MRPVHPEDEFPSKSHCWMVTGKGNQITSHPAVYHYSICLKSGHAGSPTQAVLMDFQIILESAYKTHKHEGDIT